MDTLIRGGTVYDGTGAPPLKADVLVRGGRIAAIGESISAENAREVQAQGCAVTPGFVDIHRHCDIAALTRPDFGETELAQGITTAFAGNCGLAPVPTVPASRQEQYDFIEPVTGPVPQGMAFESYQSYADACKRADLPLNMGFLAAAGAIKVAVKGFVNTPYTDAQLDRAAGYVREAMDAGAYGVSLGIMYQPECYSAAREIARVVKPAAGKDGILCTHIRGEGDSLAESVDEVIEIARQAGLRLNISHFKATGIHNWRDKIFRAIERIEAARAKGIEVTADFYPYAGGSTTLQSLLPPALLEAGNAAAIERLAAKEGKEQLRRELYRDQPGWDNMATSIGWDRILISSVTLPGNAPLQGLSIAAAASGRGYADASDFVADLFAQEKGKVGIIVLSMSMQDVDDIARLPYTALISDALYGGGGNPHPRLYGSFPKFIREFVRERGVLTMQQAIHKMTGMPAKRMGLADSGTLTPGKAADLLVFPPETFTDNADYAGLHEPASGLRLAMISGEPVFQDGVLLTRGGGRLLCKG